MTYTRQMLNTCPLTYNVDGDLLATTIDALTDCAQACFVDTGCDLSEENVAEMVKCIRLCGCGKPRTLRMGGILTEAGPQQLTSRKADGSASRRA